MVTSATVKVASMIEDLFIAGFGSTVRETLKSSKFYNEGRRMTFRKKARYHSAPCSLFNLAN